MLTRADKQGSNRRMKTKLSGLMLALCFLGASICFAADPWMGTWKLNESKSKVGRGMGKNHTVVYQEAGRKVKVIVDGVDKNGKPTHNEWTGKFDGKDYAVTGDPNSDMRSYRKVDDRTLEIAQKQGGKVTSTGQIVVSADGKSRTVNISGTDPKGKKFKTMA